MSTLPGIPEAIQMVNEDFGLTSLEKNLPVRGGTRTADLPLGGRTTISPPSNVTSQSVPYQILVSGIDKLVLAIDVKWISRAFFDDLAKMKCKARDANHDVPFQMPLFAEETQAWKCLIKPHGSQGYEWLLIGKDFSFRIGNWMKPSTRPSVMAEIHSETLWRIGPESAVDTILLLLQGYGGKILSVKPSRVDLCADLLMPERNWNQQILKNIVTRANHASAHFDLKNKKLQGISIGKGNMKARIYDKELEIKQQSRKQWMYDLWGIQKIPESFKIIRIEFQLRREPLKELGINNVEDLFRFINNLWAYCTGKWLKFRDNPQGHHTQRTTLLWWKSVQNGFNSTQKATPLIRCKALNAEEKQLFNQAYGMISSIQAVKIEKSPRKEHHLLTLYQAFVELIRLSDVFGKNNKAFAKDVECKRSKYMRLRIKNEEAEKLRLLL